MTQEIYQVKTAEFSGPMEKLLELIEARHIEITRVSLAEVTGDFITYVEKLGQTVSPTIVADFVVIAARLLVLKSKVLLPSLELSGDEEAEIVDLEQRLRLYREFKSASLHLKTLWDAGRSLMARPLLASLGDPGNEFFYPSAQVTNERLHGALQNLLQIISGLIPESKTVYTTMVTLQEKIRELTIRLKNAASVTLKGKVTKKEKQEVIVLFLAVLHMLANRLADVEQGDTFGDIVVTNQSGALADEGDETLALGKLT